MVTYRTDLFDPVMVPRTLVLALAVGLMGVHIFGQAFRGKLVLAPMHRTFLLILGIYTLLTGISALYAVNNAEAIFDLSKVVLMGALWVAMHAFLKDRYRFAKGVLVAGIIVQLAGWFQNGLGLQELAMDAGGLINSGGALMANKNLFASFVLLTLPFGLLVAITFRGWWQKLAIGYLPFSLVTCGLLQTRAVWMAIVLAGSVTVLLYLLSFKRSEAKSFFVKSKVVRYALPLGLAAVTVIAALFISNQKLASMAFGKTSYLIQNPGSYEARNGSVGNRIDLWQHTLSMIKEDPFLGKGLGSWKFKLPEYGQIGHKTEQGRVHFQRPHNDFLWVAAESGIPAMLAYLALFAILLLGLVKLIFRTTSPEKRKEALCIVLGLLSYTTVALFSFPHERILHGVLLMALFVYGSQLLVEQSGGLQWGKKSKLLLGGTLATMGVLIAVVAANRMQGEKLTRELYVLNEKRQYYKMVELADQAQSIFYSVDPMATPVYWYRGVASFSMGQVAQAKEDFGKAMEFHPNHLHVLNNLASCNEVLGKPDQAILYYEKALSLSPGFAESLCNLSAVYFNLGRNAEAYATISRCDIKGVLPNSYESYVMAILKREAQPIENDVLTAAQIERLNYILNNAEQMISLHQKVLREERSFLTTLRSSLAITNQ